MKHYTSESSPLRIAELAVPHAYGLIGMTLCPGKKGPSASEHCWERDLYADVSAIARWRAAAVITLLEDFELDMLEVRELGATVRAQGLDWCHFEITDGQAPDGRFESAWPAKCRRLCDLLRDGKNVLIHCRGGLGRTGMVAALLLREFGVVADVAIEKVREARPGAIETRGQEDYVRNYLAK